MFSVAQKREIADAVQKILRLTDHPELPAGEIQFLLHVAGAESWSWADIQNNGAVPNPEVNPWNEKQDHLDPNADFGSFFAGVRAVAKGGETESVFEQRWRLTCGHVIEVKSHRELATCPACGAFLFRCPECLKALGCPPPTANRQPE